MSSGSIGSAVHAAPVVAPAGAMRAAPVVHAAPVHGAVASHPPARTVSSNLRAAAPHRAWHPAAPVAPIHRRAPSPANSFAGNGHIPVDSFPVPGLGFDYPHFFATHPNFGRTHRTTGFILPFFGGGIYVPYPYYVEPPTEEEQAAEYNPNDSQDTAADSSDRNSAAPTEQQPAVRASYAPMQSESEYVFVRRDGTVFFAVAYTWVSDKLQYITKDGLRRSVALDSIDLNATQQFNEQRGISIHLPA
jgi:hypothetical protein